MIRTVSLAAMACLCFAATAQADIDEDEIVRLPGQGEVRDKALREHAKGERLKPGAGLFITFDKNGDGRISASELDAGIPVAFETADENGDGHLTAFEQQDWAEGLPTRDDSLANPFRFDPNLDRRVHFDEFKTVIENLGLDYADELSGDILIADLKAPPPERPERLSEDDPIRDQLERGRPQRSGSVRD